MNDIDIFKVLDFIRDTAPKYASAKANRIYLEEYRRTMKSELMFEALQESHKTIADREAYAYSHPSYQRHLEALRQAVEAEEQLRWLMVGAQAKCDVWRSLSASNRMLDKGAA